MQWGLPASFEVQSGSLDVRQCSHSCIHQERGEHLILHSHAADDMPEVVWLQGHQAGASPSIRSAQHPGQLQIDFATFANGRLIKFVLPYPDPRADWTDAMSTTWDNGRGLLYVFLPFKLVPQVLQKIYQSHGVQMILVAPKQERASWFPELLELSQEVPIPLYAKGQLLLTQDIILPN